MWEDPYEWLQGAIETKRVEVEDVMKLIRRCCSPDDIHWEFDEEMDRDGFHEQ